MNGLVWKFHYMKWQHYRCPEPYYEPIDLKICQGILYRRWKNSLFGNETTNFISNFWFLKKENYFVALTVIIGCLLLIKQLSVLLVYNLISCQNERHMNQYCVWCIEKKFFLIQLLTYHMADKESFCLCNTLIPLRNI